MGRLVQKTGIDYFTISLFLIPVIVAVFGSKEMKLALIMRHNQKGAHQGAHTLQKRGPQTHECQKVLFPRCRHFPISFFEYRLSLGNLALILEELSENAPG